MYCSHRDALADTLVLVDNGLVPKDTVPVQLEDRAVRGALHRHFGDQVESQRTMEVDMMKADMMEVDIDRGDAQSVHNPACAVVVVPSEEGGHSRYIPFDRSRGEEVERGGTGILLGRDDRSIHLFFRTHQVLQERFA